jgi:hypothetical protein
MNARIMRVGGFQQLFEARLKRARLDGFSIRRQAYFPPFSRLWAFRISTRKACNFSPEKV